MNGMWWPRLVGAVVALAAVVAFIYVYQDIQHNREIAECHTAAMDELHENLGNDLYAHPDDPVQGVAGWPEDFKAWEQTVSKCGMHNH